MATFVYSPQIRVRIATHNQGTLDISEDLIAGSMTIRTNGVHTFSFQLQNAMRKYDRVIQPMDRIVVEMKRIAWVRVFSGYLNNGPIFSVWPRVLNLSASCTLKRLQFWYWDSTAVKSQQLIQSTLGTAGAATNDAGQQSETSNAGPAGQDANVRETVVKLLSEVVGWPQEKVHVAEIPATWFTLAEELYSVVHDDNEQIVNLIGDFASGGTIGGSSVGAGGGVANGVLQPGNYGGAQYDAEQANNASAIYNAAIGAGVGPEGAIIGIMTAWQEATMRNINFGDRDSLGLFQQRAPWGPASVRTNPTQAAQMFYNGGQGGQPGLKSFNWQSMSKGAAAQRVQRSAFPSAYDKWEATARAAVDTINRSPGAASVTPPAQGGAAPAAPGAAPAAGGAPPVGSGRNVALVAANLITSKPPGHIRYQLGGDDPYTSPDPRVLDCSSLVDWVYYNAVGRPIRQGRSNTKSLTAWTRPMKMSVENAKYVKGALLYMGGDGGGVHHVEVSLGNGNTAGAHTDSVPLEKQVTVGPAGNGWSHAGLMPGVDYRDAATNQAAAAEVSRVIGQPTTVSDPNEAGAGTMAGGQGAAGAAGPDGNAAFNAFVNVYVWGLSKVSTADYLPGPKALANDEPILPYISNLLGTVMRSWCSAPNGDFMSWFPDYFGMWDSAAKMNVRSIELMDFTVEWYDQEIVTHQYVIGAPAQVFDTRTATVSGKSGSGQGTGLNWLLASEGVASVDYPKIFNAIFGETASVEFITDYVERFGGRPNVRNMPAIRRGRNEFFMALYLWMQRWANQFRANVPMTFMPELWPGMLLCLPEYEFQAYVLEVTHQFQFGPGGGFHTSAKICAPARTTRKTDIFGLLPLAGSAR